MASEQKDKDNWTATVRFASSDTTRSYRLLILTILIGVPALGGLCSQAGHESRELARHPEGRCHSRYRMRRYECHSRVG